MAVATTNQTTISVPDLFTKLSTFLQAQGWTEDNSDTDRLEIHNGTSFVQFRWDEVSPNHVSIYSSTAYVALTDPGSHTNDDGMGAIGTTDADFENGRRARLGSAPIQFWCFADGTANYAHVVVRVDATRYVHFGFGILDKFGDWTGGEYCYGHYDNVDSFRSNGSQRGDFLSYLLDGRSTYHNNQTVSIVTESDLLNSMPTMRIVAGQFPGSIVSDWAVVAGARHPFNTDVGDDRGGNQRSRCFGGYRDGTTASAFGGFNGRSVDGIVPMYQIPVFYTTASTGLAGTTFYLGSMPDVRGINIAYFAPGETITIGGETWTVFPVEPKGTVSGSYNGVAYRAS